MGLLQDILDSQFRDAHEKAKRKQNGAEEPSLLGALKDPQFRQDVKRGLLDAANRGGVAMTVGAPADIGGALMNSVGMAGSVLGHKLGLLSADQMYQPVEPTFGSEWWGKQMQDRGMVSENRNMPAEVLSSLLVPGAMTKAGQGLFKAEQAAIQNAKIAGPVSDSRLASQRGVFGGINAKTADKAKLAQAEQMLNKGVDPAQVWKETGWGRGPDGKWRFEIDDSSSKMLGQHDAAKWMAEPGPAEYPIGQARNLISHKGVEDSYPQALDTKTVLQKGADGSGSYIPNNNGFGPLLNVQSRFDLGGTPTDAAKSTTLHELQHAIQQREGFARGGSPEQFQSVPYADLVKRSSTAQDALIRAREAGGIDPQTGLSAKTLNESIDGLSQQIASWKDPHQQYLSLGGEAEARLVQSRMNLTPEQRLSQYPWDADYFKQQTGVGLDDLIHRFDGGEAKSVGFTYPQDAALETARQNGVKMLGLPENNTPMDRAKALGFDTEVLHGTTNDFPAFSESARHSVYATQDPAIADIYANATGRHKALREVNADPNVMPLVSRGNQLDISDFRNGSGGWFKDNLSDALGTEVPNRGMWKVLPEHGYDYAKAEMDDLGGRQHQFIYPNPNVLRSRFAAFDPARVNENDLLAGAMPFGLLLDPENRAKLGFGQ